MKSACARCGAAVSANGSCRKCAAAGIKTEQASQYGMLDLGAAEAGGSLALDTAVGDAPRARPARPRTGSGTTHQADAPRTKSGSQPTLRSGGRAASAALGEPATAKRAAPTAPRGQAKAQAAALPDAQQYGRGMMLDDDPLNSSFAATGAPALELVHDEPQRQPKPEPEPEDATPVESPEQARARTIAELAAYGAPPANVLGAPAYWVRVMLRKRVLETELVALSAQRKRADGVANDALVAMGQALHALSGDERTAKLQKLFAAIDDAGARIGDVEAAGQKRKQGAQQELTRLDRDLAKLEQLAAPLRAREGAISDELAKLEASCKRGDAARRKAEAELEAMQRKGGGDVEAWGALQAEREARHGEVQSLGIQMRPLQDDLGTVRKELARHMQGIAQLQEEKQSAATALERAQQNHRVSSGSARGALQQALIALANAGFKHRLGGLVPEQASAVTDAQERVQERRAAEELHRSAVASYDHPLYAQGMMILVGGSGAALLGLIIAILF